MTSRPSTDPRHLLDHLGWSRALARRLVDDPDVADDVLQRVCLVALQKPPQHGTDGGWRRWLAGVTRRLARHAARAEGRRHRRERVAARDERLPATIDVAAHRELLRHLVDAVTALEEPDYSAIVLRYYEGLSVDAMAGRLGVTPEAVRQRLSRARRHLRGRLESRLRGDGSRALASLLATPAAPSLLPSVAKSLGGLAMARSASVVTLKLVLGAGVVSAVAVGTWLVLDSPAVDPSPPVVVVEPSQPLERPVSAAPAPPTAVAERMHLPAATSSEPSNDVPPVPAPAAAVGSLAAGTTQLDQAALSCLTPTPDLLALQRALWELALSSSVIEDSVARNPNDGSVAGWLDIAGSDRRASFTIGADGSYHIQLESDDLAALAAPFLRRDMGVRFRDDAGTVAQGSTVLQFHANTNAAHWETLLAELADGPRYVGWHLDVGPDGTRGRPLAMRRTPDGTGVEIGQGGEMQLPDLEAPWATDTSAHAAWLALLRPHAP